MPDWIPKYLIGDRHGPQTDSLLKIAYFTPIIHICFIIVITEGTLILLLIFRWYWSLIKHGGLRWVSDQAWWFRSDMLVSDQTCQSPKDLRSVSDNNNIFFYSNKTKVPRLIIIIKKNLFLAIYYKIKCQNSFLPLSLRILCTCPIEPLHYNWTSRQL